MFEPAPKTKQKWKYSEATQYVKAHNKILGYFIVSKCMVFYYENRVDCTWTCTC